MGTSDGMSLDPTGQRIAISSDKEVRIWELESGNLLTILRGFDEGVGKMVFNADGSRFFAMDTSLPQFRSSARDLRIGVWDVVTGRRLFVLQPPPPYTYSVNSANRIRMTLSLQFCDGQLLHTSAGERNVFDGNPVKP